MVKVLFCGALSDKDAWSKLLTRLQELQKSAHGPFHVLFLCGPISSPLSFEIYQSGYPDLQLKIYYLYDIFSSSEPEVRQADVFERIPDGTNGIFTAHSNLTVAYFRGSRQLDYRISNEVTSAVSSLGYRGCDVMLSDCWPSDAYQLLSPQDLAEYRVAGVDMGGSRACADFACAVRPRYHFVASSHGCFYQRTPYQNNPLSSSQPTLYTRLISIAPMSESKDKQRKWMHALSLSPIVFMKNEEIEEAPSDFSPCPYVPAGKRLASQHTGEGSLLVPAAKRFQAISEAEAASTTPSFFYSGQTQQQPIQTKLNLSAPSEAACTLFIGGLGLQSKEQELHKIMKNIRTIRRQPGKRFAFVEFIDHASAVYVIEQSSGKRPFRLDGKVLSVGWATDKDKTDQQQQVPNMTDEERLEQAMNDRQLIPPSEDAKVLYVGNLPILDASTLQTELNVLFSNNVVSVQLATNQPPPQQKWTFAFIEFENYESAMSVITRSINEKIVFKGHPLVIGWSKGNKSNQPHDGSNLLREPPTADCKVIFLGRLEESVTVEEVKAAFSTNDSEVPLVGEISSIRKPAGRDYAFIEFTNHVVAREALNRCIQGQIKLHEKPISAGWAKGRAAASDDQSADCWFCLASPSVKVHLIVSVGQHAYLALPKGGIVDHHMMVCPIDCVPSRIHLSTDARQELLLFMRSWEKFCATKGEAVITYERAIRTTGSRDHMQVHCVSIPHNRLQNVMQVFQDKADAYGYRFHEIDDDKICVEDFVVNAEGGPYQEFFYMELPFETADGIVLRRRMVHLHDTSGISSSSLARFQMSLGSEIVAAALGRPERAFWKNCVLDEASEEKLAEQIRTDFAPFDHTLK